MTSTQLAAFFTDSTALTSDTNAKLAINIATFLSVLCWIFLALFITSRFSRNLRVNFDQSIQPYVKLLIWLVPTTAMALSLYFSEFLGWRPCPLCWYQRIFIYSLSLIGLVYYFYSNKIIRYIGFFAAGICPIISIYHVLLERYPEIEGPTCDPNNPCSSPWFQSMGFLTLAGMALTACMTLLVLYYLSANQEKIEPKS